MSHLVAFQRTPNPPDAISPNCGQQRLEIYPSKNSVELVIKILDPSTIERVWTDFESFRMASAAPVPAKLDATDKAPEKH
jgi:hypothetical protein